MGDAGHQGLDDVYYNPNGHPPYIVSEAKYNKAKLSKGLADGMDQMDLEWINNLLDRVVSEEHLAAIQDAMAKKMKWGIGCLEINLKIKIILLKD